MFLEPRVDIPPFVVIPTSVLGADRSIGAVRSCWRNTVQVLFYGIDGKTHLGQYTILSHQFSAPKPTDWDSHKKVWGDAILS